MIEIILEWIITLLKLLENDSTKVKIKCVALYFQLVQSFFL